MNTAFLRQWHGYLGAFIAPSVVFFSLTGALQLFSLHEGHGGYQPARLVEELARVHKDQVFALRPPHGLTAETSKLPAESGSPAHDGDAGLGLSTLLLKWFFLVIALGLVASTAFGIVIGLSRTRGRKTMIALLMAGGIVPALLLLV